MNWGTKIVIGLALFMTFIIAMATKMVISGGDDELVEKDYYEKGLDYDSRYNQQRDAVTDSVVPLFTSGPHGLTIQFSSPVRYKLVCRRASDAKLDKVFISSTGEESFFIPNEKLKSGPWKMHLSFSVKGKAYLVEREIMMP